MQASCMHVCISLLCLSIVLAERSHFHYPSDARNMFVDSAFVSNPAIKIDKRAVPMAVRGLNALNKLLSGSSPMRATSDVYRRYEKPGDFETALREFYSVKPRNVRERKNNFHVQHQAGRVITGNVGNRRLVLRSNGVDGRPSLEVIETKFEPGPYVDQIVYKN